MHTIDNLKFNHLLEYAHNSFLINGNLTNLNSKVAIKIFLHNLSKIMIII